MTFLRVLASVSLGVLFFAMAGCSRGPVLVPVQGVVHVDGAPLKGGPRCYVIYVPDPKKGNESPHEPKATIDANGRYSLSTVDKAGATPGWYRVRVEAADVIDPDSPYVTKWFVAEKYRHADKSGLEVEVKDAGTYDFQLKSK